MKAVMRFIDNIEEHIASILLILTSILVFAQLVLRYQFNYSLSWAEELARMMIAWFIFLGSSMAVKENAHVSMDALLIVLPEKIKAVAGILIDIVNIVFCIIIVYAGIGMLKDAVALGSTATAINVPLYIPYASVPVGVFLMLLHYIVKLKEKMASLVNERKKEKGA
ncbi:C4-dicarboxylate transporter DctQ subunit [Anaerosolibacter carboniphilus]|uniref:C4-dicarboxylate transporter DctQ subunit n=1 Tax=Anaerosolibacter carboniphilus TaxID=1417629 RepID=A0A841KVN0_9FIRM|nr:TRAP transporter small permease [Anaerosolibacter carboniphilus]MBB6217443.1 C4-dicarboxylate transporter DctQ subunit [Anaerosolibacter carboniphilus]